jgi:hypothetical protein
MTSKSSTLAKMFEELDRAPSIYQPSKFWQKLNKLHINQLSRTGIKNFKRSVNMRYFNWGILGIQWLKNLKLSPIF